LASLTEQIAGLFKDVKQVDIDLALADLHRLAAQPAIPERKIPPRPLHEPLSPQGDKMGEADEKSSGLFSSHAVAT
jgi:hypothetical protein